MKYRVSGCYKYTSPSIENNLKMKNFIEIIEADIKASIHPTLCYKFKVTPDNLQIWEVSTVELPFKELLTQKLEKCIQEDPVENTYKTVKEYLAEQGFEIESTRDWLYPSRWVLDLDYKFKVQVDLIYNDKDTFNLSVKAQSKYLTPPYIANYVELTPTSVLGTIKHCLLEIGEAL